MSDATARVPSDEPAKITIVGCDLWAPHSQEGPEPDENMVTRVGPGGWLAPRSDDSVITLRKGSRIRALDGGGFVIETVEAPQGPIPPSGSIPVSA